MRFSSGVRSIASNTIALTSARAIAALASLFYILVIARVLGPELYGLIAYGQSWYGMFITFSLLGLGTSLATRIGEDRAAAPEAIAESGTIRLVAGLFCLVLANAVAYVAEPDAGVRLVLFCFSLAMIGRIAWTHWVQIFLAFEHSKLTLQQEAIFRPLEAGMGVALVLAGAGVIALALLHAGIWLAQAVCGYALARRLSPIRLAPPNSEMTATLRRFGPLGLGALMDSWLVLGPVILGRMILPAFGVLGQLSLIITLTRLMNVGPSNLAASAMPVLRRTITRGEDRYSLYASTACRALPIAAALTFIAAQLFGMPLILWIFGPNFAETAHWVPLVPIIWLPLAMATAVRPVLVAHLRIWSAVAVSAAGAIALLGGALILGRAFGAVGLLIAAALAYSVRFAAVATALRIQLRIQVISWKALGLFGAIVALTLALDGLLPADWISRSLPAAGMVGACLAGAWFCLLSQDERSNILSRVGIC